MKIEEQIDRAFAYLPKGMALCFTGPSGTGKTYNANRVAKKFGLDLVLPEDRKTSSTAKEFIMFYEEAQRMKRADQEELLQKIDNSSFMTLEMGSNGIPRPKVSQVKFIFCTTHLGDLIEAIRTRCVEINFQYYCEGDMREIILKNFPKFSDSLVENILKASKGTPRQCVKIGGYTQTFMQDMPEREAYHMALETMGLNPDGFSRNDVLYLLTLYRNRTTSEKHLSNSLGLDIKTVKDTVENYLYRNDYVEIGSRGRSLTAKGNEYVRKNLL